MKKIILLFALLYPSVVFSEEVTPGNKYLISDKIDGYDLKIVEVALEAGIDSNHGKLLTPGAFFRLISYQDRKETKKPKKNKKKQEKCSFPLKSLSFLKKIR